MPLPPPEPWDLPDDGKAGLVYPELDTEAFLRKLHPPERKKRQPAAKPKAKPKTTRRKRAA